MYYQEQPECGHRRGRHPHHDPRRDHDRRHHGNHPGRGRGGRAGRGDLRNVILSMLETESLHGYQIITMISEKTEGNWSPSPGTVYPTLSLLEDEGLIVISNDMGRKMARLSEAGKELVAGNREEWSQILEAYRAPRAEDGHAYNLRAEFHKVREIVKAAPQDKSAEIVDILRKAAAEIKKLSD
ncbi:PadR family transcriptional regulator [Corynebacterium callunae]|uniref:PadR family transcriptional regulator n=1 Tax=Corynebacterium callunae TaxID=1721 RepID=UPI003981CBF0